MTRQRKIIFLIAAALFAAGTMIGTPGWIFLISQGAQDDMKQLVKTYPVSVSEIQIDTEQTDVRIYTVPEDHIVVTYYDNSKQRYTFEEDGGGLKIVCREHKRWYEYLKIHWFEEPDDICLVGIPSNYMGALQTKTMTGNIELADIAFKNDISLTGAAGDIYLSGVVVEGNLYADVTTGNLELENITVGNNCVLQATTGELEVEDTIVDGRLGMAATTGDIYMENVSAEIYEGKLTTGNISFKAIKPEEQAFFETTTGDIQGTVDDEQALYRVDGQTTLGDLKLPESSQNEQKRLQVKTVTGDINISFLK